MKSIYQYLIYICTAFSIASCNYLDVVPDNVPTLDNAFSDRYTAEQYLATCYCQSRPDGTRIREYSDR